MGNDRRFYSDNTPLDVGLDEENINDVDVYQSCTVTLKWQLKGQKPIVYSIFLVSFVCQLNHNFFQEKKFHELKAEFCKKYELNVENTGFVFDSDKIKNEDTPESLGLEDGDCIDVYTA